MPFISSPTLNFTTMVKKLGIDSTYELSSSATQVDEGQQITFTLNTTNVLEGTLVPYSLGGDSGITVDDYEIISNTTLQNSENFVIDASGQASVTYLIKDDSAIEGTETLTLFLDNGEDDISVDLIDKTESYQLSSSATQVDEGQQVTFTLSTTGLAENTSVPYTIQDSSDITSQALTNPDFNTDINDWTNTVGTHSSVAFDSKYGGSQKHSGRFNNATSSRATLTHSTSGLQTIKVRVNIPEVTYFHNLAYVSVWKNQTEFLSPTSWVEIQSHPNLSDSGILNHNGNANFWAGYIEIEYTEDVDLNDTYEVYFAFASTSYATLHAYCYVDSVEITSSAGFVSVNDLEILDSQTSTFNSISDFSGNFTVDASGQASVTYLIKDDSAIEETETLTLSLDNGEDDISVDLIDNDDPVPITYQLSSSATQVDEGGQVTITLSTTGLAENTSVPYTLQGSSEVTSQFLTNYQFNTDGHANDWTNTGSWPNSVVGFHWQRLEQRHQAKYNTSTSTRATITHQTSGTQTITVRVNITEVTYPNNSLYVAVRKNGNEWITPAPTWVEAQNYPNMSETSTSNPLGDGNVWAGYVESEYTEDVDLNSTYEVYLGFKASNNSSYSHECYVDSWEITSSLGAPSISDLEILDSQAGTFSPLSDLSGNFTVNASGQDSKTYLVKDDSDIEETETLTLSLDNGEDNISVDLIDQTPSTTTIFQDDLQSDASGWTLQASGSGGNPPAYCAFEDAATSGLSTGSIRMRGASYGYWGQAFINVSHNFIEGNNYRLSFDILTHVPSPSNQDYSFGIRTIPSSGVGSSVSLNYISSNNSSGISNLTGDNFPYTFTHDFVGVSSITSGCQIYISTGGLPYNSNSSAGIWFNNVKIEAI